MFIWFFEWQKPILMKVQEIYEKARLYRIICGKLFDCKTKQRFDCCRLSVDYKGLVGYRIK
jgi:hypothetical protein